MRTAPDHVKNLIIAQLPTMCRNKVRFAWSKHRVELADHIVIAKRDGVRTRRGKTAQLLCGVALVQSAATHLYVDIICSNMRYGGKILGEVEKMGKKLGKETVKLSALRPVVGWYKKKGYQHKANACREKRQKVKGSAQDGYRMSKCIKMEKKARSRSRSVSRKRSRSRKRFRNRVKRTIRKPLRFRD